MTVGEEATFARNSEVLQNDLSEYYDPIGHWDARIRRREGYAGELC